MAVRSDPKVSASTQETTWLPTVNHLDLNIAVIGAGMGGLGVALSLAKKGFRNINVYENVSSLGFTGAGIQLTPNIARILDRLGCWAPIYKEATDVKAADIRQGSSGETLTKVPMPNIAELYGYPHCTGHRASLAGHMLKACEGESAIKFHFGWRLTDIVQFSPQAVFKIESKEGEQRVITSDVLIASDGIKSVARQCLLNTLGKEESEKPTEQAAYRIMLTRNEMKDDHEMLALLESDDVIRWIGEKRHIIAYPVQNHTIYNLSTCQPDKNFASVPSTTYTTRGSKKVMLDVFSDFCPLIQRMLNKVPEGEVCEWRLRMHNALPAWVHGSVALIGDACHPTLPHLSQGAAMAIEDGVVIAEVLTLSPDTNPKALNISLTAYQLLRKEWCSNLVEMAYQSGRTLHLGEGKDKDERDRAFAETKAGKSGLVPDKWASPDVQKMIYSNDVTKEIKKRFATLYAEAESVYQA